MGRCHWGGCFRECPPAFGLPLDFAAPSAPVASAANSSGLQRLNTTLLPDSGRRGIQRSGIKEEANGRGTAAESECRVGLSPPRNDFIDCRQMQQGQNDHYLCGRSPALHKSGFRHLPRVRPKANHLRSGFMLFQHKICLQPSWIMREKLLFS